MKKQWFITFRYDYGCGVTACGSETFFGTEEELQKHLDKFDERYDNFHWSEIQKAR